MGRCTAPSSSRARCCRLAPTTRSSHALGRRGWDVALAVVPPTPDGPVRVLLAYREVVTAGGADLVVAHSNAGRYAAGGRRGPPRGLRRRGAATGARRRAAGTGGAARPPRRPRRRRRAAAAVDPLVGRARPRGGHPRPAGAGRHPGGGAADAVGVLPLPARRARRLGRRTRRPTSRSARPTPRRSRSRASTAGRRRCSRAPCTCTTSSTRMPWPRRCSTSPSRLGRCRSDPGLVPGRRPRGDRAGDRDAVELEVGALGVEAHHPLDRRHLGERVGVGPGDVLALGAERPRRVRPRSTRRWRGPCRRRSWSTGCRPGGRSRRRRGGGTSAPGCGSRAARSRGGCRPG